MGTKNGQEAERRRGVQDESSTGCAGHEGNGKVINLGVTHRGNFWAPHTGTQKKETEPSGRQYLRAGTTKRGKALERAQGKNPNELKRGAGY